MVPIVKPEKIIEIGLSRRSHTKIYKELETLNFVAIQKSKTQCGGFEEASKENVVNLMTKPRVKTTYKVAKYESPYKIFSKSMRINLIWGQIWGINPVLGVLEDEASKVRFSYRSWKCIYTLFVLLNQVIVASSCFYWVFSAQISVTACAFLSFHAACCISTALYIRMASKWPSIAREVNDSDLTVDPNIKFKCARIFLTMLSIILVENILSIINAVTYIQDCLPDRELFKTFTESSHPFVFENQFSYSFPLAIYLHFVKLTCMMNWNYSDLFIICVSIYLTGTLKEIIKKIQSAKHKDLPSSHWRNLRLHYTTATRLVRVFDDVISTITFVSFASTLFFICLQLFNLLVFGFAKRGSECPNDPSGPFGGYEQVIYTTFSLLSILARSITVSLYAASVHSASLEIAPALYEVPPTAYCNEVQRFIEQAHGDKVALTGCQFFHITRGLVLSVAATIVTYELVLIQFNGENMIKK